MDLLNLTLKLNDQFPITEADARCFIRSAIYDDGAITQSDIKSVMDAKYRMLSVVRAESIAALRRWAEGRTVSVD